MESQIGTIDPGKLADVIADEGNPLEAGGKWSPGASQLRDDGRTGV